MVGRMKKLCSIKIVVKFDIYLNEIFSVASAKINSLGIIRNCLNLSQAKILYSFSIPSNVK